MKKIVLLALMIIAAPAFAQDRITKYDKNGDNVVDFGELNLACNVSKGLFRAADKNKDGGLNNAEMRTAKAYLFRSCKKTDFSDSTAYIAGQDARAEKPDKYSGLT